MTLAALATLQALAAAWVILIYRRIIYRRIILPAFIHIAFSITATLACVGAVVLGLWVGGHIVGWEPRFPFVIK